jgi:LysE type translocator
MPLEQLLALAILAFVGSYTPGPNNMIATVTGANHGFRAALPHVFGVPFGFSSMLIASAAGVAALLLTYPFIAALLKWAGIAYLLFIAWQLAPACDGQGPKSHRHEAAFILAIRCVPVCQPEGMDARCGHGRIVHGEQCYDRQHCNYCRRVFDRCHGQSYHLGLGRRRPAKLAKCRLANANL